MNSSIVHRYISILSIFIFFISCKKESNSKKSELTDLYAFDLINSADSGIDFINNVENQEDFNVLSYRNYYNGGGVAIGDINNDGLNDIYFTVNLTDNKLYLNKGDLKFEDVSKSAGVTGKKSWATGVTMADVNADGFLDIYVCYSGEMRGSNKENELFINLGVTNGSVPKFKEAAKEYGLNDAGLSTHASFFDYDLDGDLDCYVLNNSYKDPERISLFKRDRFELGAEGGDRLYQNDGKGHFSDVTKESGIFSSNIGFGLGISVGDVNNDFWPDIYISNDFWERDYLYINNKNGTFAEQLTDRMSYTSVSSMGSDIADINNDGNLDIFSTDMLPPDNYRLKAATKFDDYYLEDIKFKNSYFHQFVQNCLHINRGDATFQETAFYSGVAATDWSWGALIFDMNLDGQKDLFVSNGVYHDITNSDFVDFIADKDNIKQVIEEKGRYDFRDFEKFLPHNKRKNYAYINKTNLQFENAASILNLDQESYSNGSAYGDLDNDGDYDLVVNNVNMEAFVYKNNAVENNQNFLKIKLNGQKLNKKGIGATITIFNNDGIQKNQVMMARGFQSSVDPDLIFGLGKKSTIDSLIIVWPDRKYETLKNIKTNQSLNIDYSNARGIFENKKEEEPIFEEKSESIIIGGATHAENIYNDFDTDRLIPHMLSNEGPKIIKGDVNKDGKEDFLLLGGSGSASQLFINQGAKFVKSIQQAFENDKKSEGISGAFFDADKDGDLDLLIGTGGNEYKNGIESFASLYYLNDGKGNFQRELIKAPLAKGQIGCVKPYDMDKDGDLDLFLGGRAIPGVYGLTPRSFMFENDGNGHWTDVTNEFTGPIGMVTDAIWTDVNNDTWADLIVVGEWMPITVFLNNNGELIAGNPLANSNGWWTRIKAHDLDEDGDLDFLVGNWGENMKIKASVERPLSLYISDFDDNKRPDAIMEWYPFEEQKPYPFASKQDITAQMPFLKKQILKYGDYAEKQVSDLFPKSIFEKAQKKIVNNFQTSVIWNNGTNFDLKPFNVEAQMAPVFAIEIADLDGDNQKDIYLGGNFYKLKPEIGRHDGFNGGYFKGLGNGKYTYISSKKSGIFVSGEVRDSQIIDEKLFVSGNNSRVQIFCKK
ncbi:MAG: VCBS repeat-containing protein [Bacteroidota bacterium]